MVSQHFGIIYGRGKHTTGRGGWRVTPGQRRRAGHYPPVGGNSPQERALPAPTVNARACPQPASVRALSPARGTRRTGGAHLLRGTPCPGKRKLPRRAGGVRSVFTSRRGLEGPGGGARGIRTPDLLIANETRYQLRHSPKDGDQHSPPPRRARTGRAGPRPGNHGEDPAPRRTSRRDSTSGMGKPFQSSRARSGREKAEGHRRPGRSAFRGPRARGAAWSVSGPLRHWARLESRTASRLRATA